MRIVFALCLLAPSILGAADEWRTTLHRVAQTVAVAVNRSDNYICVQDLSRFYYLTPTPATACKQPPAIPEAPLYSQDRLKLDVAVSQGVEIYSWHGENKFSAQTVGQLVREGPISSGSFNGYLRNIFGESGVTFSYRGLTKANGLDVHQFDYAVPLKASHYQVQAGKGLMLVPFHGSFSARADDFQLYSLTVTANTDQLTKKSNICAVQSTLIYQLVRISNHESLLPSSFDLLMGSRDQNFTESKGKYSECREYGGESTVRFDATDPAAEIAAPVMSDTEPLRRGILLDIALSTPIDENSAYAGQPVEGTLRRNAKVAKGKVLARGATVRGTITGFKIYDAPVHRVSLNIEFSSIADGKKLYLCSTVHNIPVGLPFPRRIGPHSDEEGLSDGTMMFTTSHLHLDKSFTTLFVTVDQSETESQ